ncbi:MAG: glucosylceramidase [Firmicutes bacterium]|nr:glucosylceramidase [Bacillota bacterium]
MDMHLVQSDGKELLRYTDINIPFVDDTGVENEVINLYPCMEYQRMEGFGGAITDSAGYVFAQMNEEQKDILLTNYFKEENMNYQMVRIPIDSCDFATHIYSAVIDKDDSKLHSFSFADTERYIIPMLNAAEKKAGKKLKIMLSAWSPPAFMKTNESRLNGGALKPEYRQTWAEYICRYIKEFRNRGYLISRLTIQNEPKAVQPWDSCVYSAKEEKVFLQDFLYPTLKRHGLDHIEIFIWDHNKERVFERASEIIDNETNNMVAGIAFHWYSGDHFEALNLVREKFTDKKLILSESCLEFNKYDPAMENQNAARLAHDMIGNLNHGMNAFYDWNILLNQLGGPNHVNNYCDAPYLYDEVKKELVSRMIQRYYWHFAHFIKTGAVRIAYTKYTSKLDVTAWRNPDNSIVIIVLNSTDQPIPCVLRLNGKMAEFVIQSNAIASGIIHL